MPFLSFLYTYLLGGVTFLPLLVIVFIYLHPKDKTFSQPDKQDDDDESPPKLLSAGEIEEDSSSGILAYKSGWLIVTQEYLESPDEISSQTQSINESSSAYSTLYKLVKNNNPNGDQNEVAEPISPRPANDKTKSLNKKHRYYALLKHGNLFLYKSQDLKDVKHVIVLSNQFVTLWPRDLPDGQLFTKRASICLIKKDWTRRRRLSENFENDKLTVQDILQSENNLTPPQGSFFIYCDTNIEKEDWYFTLIKASKSESDLGPWSSQLHAKTLHFQTDEMMDLIQTLYSSEGQLQTKWFNGLLGRLFLSLKRTDMLRNFLETRITKKLNKIKTPGFLDKFKLGNLDPGDSIPFFTYPNLKEINPNGTLLISSYVHYHGNLSCNISTKVNLNFGGRFTQSQVDVVLKVTVQKIEGPVIFKIKPPPSDRIWYSFEIEPLINLKIEPIISSRPITYSIITSTIEKRFKDAIKESLVVPNYDDVVFFDTEGDVYRAGVWDKTQSSDSSETALDDEMIKKSELNTDDAYRNDQSIRSVRSVDSDTSSIDKLKLTATLSDLSQKIKKSKSTHTVGVTGSNFLSDGSIMEPRQRTLNKNLNKTFKKIGDWYNSKDETKDKKEQDKVEMYSNRRRPRQASNERIPEQNLSSPVDMFAKNKSAHSRSSSKFSVSSDYSQQSESSPRGDFSPQARSLRAENLPDDNYSTSSLGPPTFGKFASDIIEEESSIFPQRIEMSEEKPSTQLPVAALLKTSSGNSDFSVEQMPELNEKIPNPFDEELNELIQLDHQVSNENEPHRTASKLHRRSPPPL
ncbi:hypothetical protein CANTEDRAFT_92304 [Yamadazyma tenuis ATCC 10573]|uniref:SMP-LTD domain-containing protein n=2 Tax=Candida tenuis TaxID=2315449 RepID=G3AYX9_CANTC|nr:uncharacterized protein CANTEDRAFT_92304 [Yamadazyma tenuis ATCC 10573]EGV65958.1 hypothetical protein CANTEDRAFT_92304 [Yamadazyma tenuis ATCC 10573]